MGNKCRTGWIAVTLAAWLGFADRSNDAWAQFGFSSQFELSSSIQLSKTDSSAARAHLERVKAFISDEQWDEAVETLRQVMEDHGDQVIALVPGRTDPNATYVTVRDYCHAQIASLPAEALKLYRDRVDPLARLWYEEGVAKRDTALLLRVVEQVFVSSWGDDALLALGELALERGHYGAARNHWERISPLLKTADGEPWWIIRQRSDWEQKQPQLTVREKPPDWIAYPDTDLDLADMRARLVWVSILEDTLDRARLELDILTGLHPQAEGTLGGRRVNYVHQLAALLEAGEDWPRLPPKPGWQTFAGSPQRAKVVAAAAPLDGRAWKELTLGEPLSADATMARAFGFGGRRVGEDFDKLLSYHPLVVGDLLLINDKSHIRAFNVHTGEAAWSQKDAIVYWDDTPSFDAPRHGRSRLGVPRFTMTARDGKLFARMSNPVTSWPPDSPPSGRSGYLVCLDLEAQGQLLWKVEPDDDLWAFEGSPLSDGANVYVAMRRSDVRPQAYVACFDAQTGRLRWRRFVCAAETPARGQVDEITHNLLTLAENTIYYNTNLGAVAALKASDGQIVWIRSYRRKEHGDLSQPAAHFYRDLNPCIYHQGMLLVAPSDSEEILALDASTGQLLWFSNLPQDAVHLIGVSEGRLIAAGHRLWWLDTRTGNVVRRFPEPEKAGLRGYGRGMIAGREIYWPTRGADGHVIYVFDAQTAQPTQEPIRLHTYEATSGNLLLVDGYLLIAGAEKLHAFSQVSRRRESLRLGVMTHPEKALSHYLLAECEEALCQAHDRAAPSTTTDDDAAWPDVIRLYRKALELAKDDELHQGRPLADLAGQRLASLLAGRAAALSKSDSWQEAAELWRQAAQIAPSAVERLAALRQSGEALLAAGRSTEAVQAFQAIMADPELARLTVALSPEWSLQARRAMALRIDEVTGQTDRRAAAGHSEQMPANPASNAPALSFPMRQSWERAGNGPFLLTADSAADSLPLALFVSVDGAAAVSLGDGKELWKLTLDTPPFWAATTPGGIVIATPTRIVSVGAKDGALRWQLSDAADKAESGAWGQFVLDAERLFFQRGSTVVALDAGTGKSLWTYDAPQGTELGKHLHLAGDYLLFQQRPLVGPSSGMVTVVVHADQGRVLHRLSPGDASPQAAERRAARTANQWLRPPATWDRSHVVVITAEQGCELVDLAAGEPIWSRRPVGTSSDLQPDVLIGDELLLMFSSGVEALKLNPADGAAIWAAPTGLGSQWLSRPRELVAVDERPIAAPDGTSRRALYVVSGGQLQAFDLADGRPLWRQTVAIEPDDRRRTWRAQRVGAYVVAYPLEFGERAGVRLIAADPADGRLVYRSRRFEAPPGEARVALCGGHAVIAARNQMWALSMTPSP